MVKYRNWPPVLRRRWLLSILTGTGILLTGTAFSLVLGDKVLLTISVLLVACMALRCLSFYRLVHKGSYEVVEGICIEVGRAGLHGQRSVRLLQLDGNEYATLLDKRTTLRVGNFYRMFSGIDRDNSRVFLCLEDLGAYREDSGSGSEETADE